MNVTKRYLLTTMAILVSIITFSQNTVRPSDKINYQFTVRDGSNNLIINKPIGVEVSILRGSEVGPVVYTETHIPTTNGNGLATFEIGGGSVSIGKYDTISWKSNVLYFLKTRVRLPSDKTYSITGTSKFLSVPYALYSKQAGNGIQSIVDNNNGTLTFNYLDGTKYISPVLKGSTGPKGDVGPQGIPGVNGKTTLVKTSSETAGINCSTGGVKLEYGLDANNNGTLDNTEITVSLTKYVCNGTQGLKGDLGATGPQGPIGLTGAQGLKGDKGDIGAAGLQGPIGLTGAQGLQGIQGVTGVTGPKGPIGLTGVTGSQGIQGPQGATGSNGLNGKNTLVKTTTENAGANCATGGVKLEYGLDVNGNNILESTEINATLTKYVCNGNAGAQGLKGDKGDIGTQGLSGVGINNGKVDGEMLYWNGTNWVVLSIGNQGQLLTFCDGIPKWTIGGICPGKISTLNCETASQNGILTEMISVNGVTVSIEYTGGNGGSYDSQSVNSKGVLGLSAIIPAGNFTNGNGNLVYTISGQAQSSGSASFEFNIGGKSCSFSITINNTTQQPTGYGPSVTDVDGNTYKTVYIGTQQWMAENLKVSKYSDGTTIPNITDTSEWRRLTTGAWAYYNNDAANNAKYGKLYNWYAVSKTKNGNKNICPAGWHVPTDSEWTVLTDYLGGPSVAGGKMKEVGTSNWNTPNTDATNSSLFSALPGGYRSAFGGGDIYIGNSAYWWHSTVYNPDFIYNSASGRCLFNTSGDIAFLGSPMVSGNSVRCLKD